MEVLFTGFDSAWGGRLRGAICNLKGEVKDGGLTLAVREPPMSVDWPKAVSQSRTWSTQSANHVVSIDQGLVVPNATGMRPVERLLASALMGRFGCGAHASNQRRTSCYGPTAGVWDLIDSLQAQGYRHEPMAVGSRSEGRFFLECYPHPALIALFDLNRTLPYKVTRGTFDGWRQLLGHLRSLRDADLPISNVTTFVPEDLEWNKANEDHLDALVAAYVGAYLWWFGPSRSIVVGSLTEGYIATPCNQQTRDLLQRSFEAYGVNPNGLAHSVRPAAQAAAGTAAVPAAPTTTNGAPAGQSDVFELVVRDHGCLWCKHNAWMPRERCVGGWRLVVEFLELDGQPILTFGPFDNPGDQGGMKPADDDSKLEWKFIAAGATSETPQAHRVRATYVPLEAQAEASAPC